MNASFWDERYGAAEYAYGREPNDFLREEADRLPPGPVLCLAEGEGRNAVFLAARGHAVTAVDFSHEGLRKAQALAAERGVTIVTEHADLATWSLPEGAYSGVIAMWAHLPREVRQRVHGWVARALRPGGVFLLEAYTPDQIPLGTGGPKDPSMLMTLDGLRAELSGLAIEVGREVRREVHEGPFHGGPSATVQIAARRV
jgi:SAM-dependent methyltransferase